jgi:hypothetical protein
VQDGAFQADTTSIDVAGVEWFGIILEDSGRGDGGMRKTREKKAHNGKLDAGDARLT